MLYFAASTCHAHNNYEASTAIVFTSFIDSRSHMCLPEERENATPGNLPLPSNAVRIFRLLVLGKEMRLAFHGLSLVFHLTTASLCIHRINHSYYQKSKKASSTSPTASASHSCCWQRHNRQKLPQLSQQAQGSKLTFKKIFYKSWAFEFL